MARKPDLPPEANDEAALAMANGGWLSRLRLYAALPVLLVGTRLAPPQLADVVENAVSDEQGDETPASRFGCEVEDCNETFENWGLYANHLRWDHGRGE
jgi:hypothetical protein